MSGTNFGLPEHFIPDLRMDATRSGSTLTLAKCWQSILDYGRWISPIVLEQIPLYVQFSVSLSQFT